MGTFQREQQNKKVRRSAKKPKKRASQIDERGGEKIESCTNRPKISKGNSTSISYVSRVRDNIGEELQKASCWYKMEGGRVDKGMCSHDKGVSRLIHEEENADVAA